MCRVVNLIRLIRTFSVGFLTYFSVSYSRLRPGDGSGVGISCQRRAVDIMPLASREFMSSRHSTFLAYARLRSGYRGFMSKIVLPVREINSIIARVIGIAKDIKRILHSHSHSTARANTCIRRFITDNGFRAHKLPRFTRRRVVGGGR